MDVKLEFFEAFLTLWVVGFSYSTVFHFQSLIFQPQWFDLEIISLSRFTFYRDFLSPSRVSLHFSIPLFLLVHFHLMLKNIHENIFDRGFFFLFWRCKTEIEREKNSQWGRKKCFYGSLELEKFRMVLSLRRTFWGGFNDFFREGFWGFFRTFWGLKIWGNFFMIFFD